MEAQGFIELDRQFRKLDQTTKPEDAALNSYAAVSLGLRSALGWKEILEKRRVVVLGEPGSGKTREFSERSKSLNASGHFSLFIPLDRLIAEPWESVLGPESYRRFNAWKRSSAIGSFLLDSVDEAKFLREGDLLIALDHLRNALGSAAALRSHILISSRISEWRPQRDMEEFALRFPVLTKESGQSNATDAVDKSILVVQLAPLDRDRVVLFAKRAGARAPEAFVTELDKMNAWEFARRPVDVIDLLSFWGTHGRLGSLCELIEYSTACKLRATRDRNDQLTERRAREGVETLAAATVMCRKFSFRIPDESYIVDDALDAQACLPDDWRSEECRALLWRAVFDSHNYGRIRFHHRRISEYFAAQWFKRRMAQGCPKSTLEQVLFSHDGSSRILREPLGPIAAWLCIGQESWNEDVRAWVLDAAPNVHLRYGDPSALPITYRKALLRALLRQFEGRNYIWTDSAADSLSRLADPALADDIEAILRDQNASVGLREEMFQVVRHGHLHQCLQAALDVIADPDESDHIKQYAAVAIRDTGSTEHRQLLASIALRFPEISENLSMRICEATYPDVIDSNTLCNIIAKTKRRDGRVTGPALPLISIFESKLKPEDSRSLLSELLVLFQMPPTEVLDKISTPVSEQYSWLEGVLPIVVSVACQTTLDASTVENAAQALRLIGYAREIDRHHCDLPDLNAVTASHPNLRQNYFWKLVDDFRTRHGKEPTNSSQLFDRFEVLKPIPHDVRWLINDTVSRSDSRDREVALRLALGLWNQFGRDRQIHKEIRKAIEGNTNLRKIFGLLEVNSPFFEARRFLYQHVVRRVRYRYQWLRRWQWLKEQWRFIYGQSVLYRRLGLLRSGRQWTWLHQLAREADSKCSSQYTPSTWDDLRKKRGVRIAEAARAGCKNAWRNYTPVLPHEKPSPNRTTFGLVVGLAGIQASLDDAELNFAKLLDREADLLAHYGVNELNGFPYWFAELAHSRPDVVSAVLTKCIAGEWTFAASREHPYEVLHRLLWSGKDVVHLVQDFLLTQLEVGDPLNITILRVVLTLLIREEKPPLGRLGALASGRLSQKNEDAPGFYLWLSVWLQVSAEEAMTFLEDMLRTSKSPTDLMVKLCSALKVDGFDPSPTVLEPDYARPKYLRRFILLVYRHVKPSEDIDRTGGGAYSPGDRDNAQDFRGGLLSRLAESSEPEANTVLVELLSEPLLSTTRDWILRLIDSRKARSADLPAWLPKDVRSFESGYEVEPKTDADLFAIVCWRLSDIKHDVELAEVSRREDLHKDDDEYRLRRWLAGEFKRRSKNRYQIPQEEEIDQEQRPDLRVEHPQTDPISIEVKWADNWSLEELLERLEHQLADQYLRDNHSKYGIYLLGYIGRKTFWIEKSTRRQLNFTEVLGLLRHRAVEIKRARGHVAEILVESIDFRDPRQH